MWSVILIYFDIIVHRMFNSNVLAFQKRQYYHINIEIFTRKQIQEIHHKINGFFKFKTKQFIEMTKLLFSGFSLKNNKFYLKLVIIQ